MLHGSDIEDIDLSEPNPSTGGPDICLTSDSSIARQYAERYACGADAYIHEMEFVEDVEIADEDTVRDLLGLEPWSTPSEVFHAVDSSLDVLRDAGYDAVRYTDKMPGTSEKFETLRVISSGVLEVVETRTI